MSTYGSTAPSQNTINYDAVLGTSLFNYRKKLTDNISKSNPFFYKIKENGMYESEDGGIAIQVPLMYGLAAANTYSGYDILDVQPTDGITNAFFNWSQAAVPISISRLEERQNASSHRMVDLMKAKIMQAEIGIKEFFAKMLLQGAGLTSAANSIITPYANNSNGSTGIDPMGKLIHFDPTASLSIGNINQNTSSWWRNNTKSSGLTTSSTPTAFLLEADTLYNNCSKGPGGPPDLIITDQNTFQVWRTAYYDKFKATSSDNNYPFENFKFNRAVVMWDEFMPDVYSDTTTITYGSAYFINTKFMGVKYDSESNFINTEFQKPINQDAKVAHILWMGATTVSNRRKLGVWGKIPVSLTYNN